MSNQLVQVSDTISVVVRKSVQIGMLPKWNLTVESIVSDEESHKAMRGSGD